MVDTEYPWFPRELRDCSFVPRWTIIRNNHRPNLAEHHFYVAFYAMRLNVMMGRRVDTERLLTKALTHDLEETFTSDIPGPSKRQIIDKVKFDAFVQRENLKRFGVSEVFDNDVEGNVIKLMIKVADLMDEVAHLRTEMTMGNSSLETVCSNSNARLYMACKNLQGATGFKVYDALRGTFFKQLDRTFSSISTDDSDVAPKD